jgi:hypothetical protein
MALPLKCRAAVFAVMMRFCHSLPIGFLVRRETATGFQPRSMWLSANSSGDVGTFVMTRTRG